MKKLTSYSRIISITACIFIVMNILLAVAVPILVRFGKDSLAGNLYGFEMNYFLPVTKIILVIALINYLLNFFYKKNNLQS
jgi:hypothetical protein